MPLAILVTPSFARTVKSGMRKTKPTWKRQSKPFPVTPRSAKKSRGDLNGVFVHKFKLNNRETLLAYRLQPDKFAPQELVLLAVGPNENFYTQLKR